MKEPLISVILAVYNFENVSRAIKSVLNQTYTNYELIIVDDCSTDNTYKNIIEFLEENDNGKIKVYKNEKNYGTYYSRNFAITKSKGDYITNLDADDEYLPHKLSTDVDTINKYPDMIISFTSSKRIRRCYASMIFKKSIINEIGYFDSVRYGTDQEYLWRIIKVYGKHRVIDTNIYAYEVHHTKKSLTRGQPMSRRIARKEYYEECVKWHNSSNNLYMPFPLIERPFPVNNLMLP